MRSVVVYELLSLDGVAEDPDGFITDWDESMQANLDAVISTQDAVLLGRRSYEEWARYWPAVENHPFATFINAVPKYVATSSPLEPTWTNATVAETELTEFVRDLRNRDGGDIGVHASISIVQTLLAHDLVDRLKVVIAPTIAGRGRRLLDAVSPTRLEVIDAVVSRTGHLLLDYRVLRG